MWGKGHSAAEKGGRTVRRHAVPKAPSCVHRQRAQRSCNDSQCFGADVVRQRRDGADEREHGDDPHGGPVPRQRAADPAGLTPLVANAELTTAAQRHSDDMVARKYFSHTSADGRMFSQRISAAGYLTGARSYSLGENIASGSGSLGTPQKIVAGWMNSAGHRANILNASFRDSGVGVAAGVPVTGYSGGGTYTHDIGYRR
jgi:hypothetical protein